MQPLQVLPTRSLLGGTLILLALSGCGKDSSRAATDAGPIVLRCAIKPTSSLPREQRTVTRNGEPTTIAVKGRHDPCLLPRFVAMGEAMVAITLADHMLRQHACRGPDGAE